MKKSKSYLKRYIYIFLWKPNRNLHILYFFKVALKSNILQKSIFIARKLLKKNNPFSFKVI